MTTLAASYPEPNQRHVETLLSRHCWLRKHKSPVDQCSTSMLPTLSRDIVAHIVEFLRGSDLSQFELLLEVQEVLDLLYGFNTDEWYQLFDELGVE